MDLRQHDVNKIHRCVKSGLYADQFLKSEEMVMFRPASYGGLGIHHIKFKALAALTRTFLEAACNPKFRISLFLILAFHPSTQRRSFRKVYHVRTGRSWVSHTTDWESAWRWQDSQDLAQRILPSSSIVQTAQLVDAGMIVLKIWSLLSFSVL